MKVEVIPAILAQSKKDFFDKLRIASEFSKTVQIDIMDGVFVDNTTPRDLNNGNWFAQYLLTYPKTNVPKLELHLMVMDPWKVIENWKRFDQLIRVIWHIEVPILHCDMIQAVHEIKLKVGLALNPKTSITEITPNLSADKRGKSYADHILFMTVTPGWSGQRFKPSVLTKIKTLRRKYPKISIGVDGGVNLNNTPDILSSGANVLNAAGAIYLSKEPKTAYLQISGQKYTTHS